MQKRATLLLLLLGLPFFAAAQNFTMNGTPITACTGSFFDPGGPSGDYGNNLNITTTICSDGSSGTHIRLDFSGVSLDPGDVVCFYDGNSAAAPLLSCSDQYTPGIPFVVQATAANPSGCLTVVFTSNSSGTDAGWSASISCVASCQQVLADLVATMPASIPIDNGWIDICPGKRVTFLGQGVYPQNGFAYSQSDFSTEFEWSFGDGDIAYGPLVSHIFDEPGGYYVQLFLKDTLGCGSTNLINQRIRVSPKPAFNLANAFATTICAGDTLQLSAAVNAGTNGENIAVIPGVGSFSIDGSRSDSLALPDGTGIPYETSLYFTEFSPGQSLTNINDLEAISVNMEHSWARDIEIKISCPNGQEVILHNHPGNVGSQLFLGIPNDNDNFAPIPGTGWDYNWTPNAPNPSWLQYANANLPGGSGTLPSGDYSSFEPLTNLLGCPLNGEWTLTITDFWPIDNGYIFSWGINFNDLLYPNVESFQQTLNSWEWRTHPSIFYATADSIAASPQNAGTAAYTFAVTDGFGCVWDTTVNVTVLPFTHPNCFSCNDQYVPLQDTVVCVGSPVQLDGSRILNGPTEVRFEAYPDYKLGNANHPHPTPYQSSVSVNSLGYSMLNNPIAQISSVCMDIETDFDADLFVYLRSPDNKQLELTTGNGGSGDNYKITCFTPAAGTAITAGTAPFNGTYRPEGLWTALNNAQVNGDWKLLVSDGFGLNQYGKVKWWSIGFNLSNNINYTWNNTSGLSCNNCPNPVVNAAQSQTYVLTAVDNFNCTHKDTVTVGVQTFFPAPAGLSMAQMDNGMMTWQWMPLPGVSDYEVSINAGAWITVSATSYTITGLVPGDAVNIKVRALSTSVSCPPYESMASQVYVACTLLTSLNNTTPCSCPNSADGFCDVVAAGGQGQTVFFSSFGPPTPYTNGNLTFFPAGDHFVYAVDAMGCRDTSFFTITAPPAFVVNTSAVNVACFGGSTGSISANVTGGTGILTYSWQRCVGGPIFLGATVNTLIAGCYQLTVSDQSGCTATTSQTVTENPQLTFSTSQDSVSCFGLTDGSATVVATGGLMPYGFVWSTGATTATAPNLPAGLHSVTIADNAGCSGTTLIQVKQPAQLTIDSLVAGPVSCKGLINGLATVYTKGGTAPLIYQWSGTAQTTKTIINLAEGIYAVTVTDHNGCTATAQTMVTAPAVLTVALSNATNERCEGSCDGTAAILPNGGTLPYQINWNTSGIPLNTLSFNSLCPGNYNISIKDANNCQASLPLIIQAATALNIQVTATSPSCPLSNDGQGITLVTNGVTPYLYNWSSGQTVATATGLSCSTYTLTVTDANGCTAMASFTLSCPDQLAVSTIVPAPVSCFGDNNGSVLVTPVGGSLPYTYIWSDISQQNTDFAGGLGAGTYTVTVTDDHGCSITASATVDTPLAVTATTNTTPALCFGTSDGAAEVVAIGGTGNYTYLWSNGATTAVISNVPAGSYLVTVADGNNCQFEPAATIVGQPASSVSVTALQTTVACFQSLTGTATAMASGGKGSPFSYAWSNNTFLPVANNLIVGNYTVTASDGNGCSATVTVAITQHDSISVNIAKLPPTCFGYSNGQAAVNLVKGGAGLGVLSNYFLQWGGIPGAPTGDYWGQIPGETPVSLTVTDQQGCSRIFNFKLDEPTEVMPNIKTENVTCFGKNDGQATVVSTQGDNPILVYVWSSGTTGQATMGLPAGGIAVTVTDSKGCSGIQNAIITEPDPLSLVLQPVHLKCLGDSTGVIAAIVTGGTPTYNYNWNNGLQSAVINHLPANSYILTVTDVHNCVLIDSVMIRNPEPTILLLSSDDAICHGTATGRLEVTVINGTSPFLYGINNEPYGGSPIFLALYSGNYVVKVKDGNGCVISGGTVIGQPDPLSVSINPAEIAVVYGDSVLLTASAMSANGKVTYRWQSDIIEPYTCSDSLTCQTVGFVPEIENKFVVVATDENGCTGLAKAHVLVEKPRDIYVPTGFTPNSDGMNDLLHIFGKSRQVNRIKTFRIFDRWGELIYEDHDVPINDTSRGWDGTFRGADCEPAVYIWIMEVLYRDGFTDDLHGETTLIR